MKKTNTYIIAGLGNPGKKYENTRHNIGYHVVDELFDLWQLAKHRKRFSSLVSITKQHGRKIVLLKPLTYMNESGRAIKKAMSFYNVTPQNVVIVYDDIDLPVGALRIRTNGGPGTHNGMRSIVNHIGRDFARIRIGIGKNKSDLVNYVLSQPSKQDKKILEETVIDAANAIDMLSEYGIQKTMQKYNVK